MKLSINTILCLLGGLTLTLFSTSSRAAVSCAFEAGSSTALLTVPLSPPVISAGADIPVGTIIYQGSWTNAPSLNMSCTGDGTPYSFNWAVGIVQVPLPLSGLNTGLFPGAVYQTNIPGIGVAISRYNNRSPATFGTFGYRDEDVIIESTGGRVTLENATRYISLIKTGPLEPGSYTLSATNLPTASDNMVNSRAGRLIQGLPIQLNKITFQGNLTVSAQTCATPDVNVNLGVYEISKYFKGINSTTPWIDASIMLTNCPQFRGFYNQTNTTLMMDFNTGSGSVSPSINNSIGVRLTPIGDIIDATNGIMAIDSSIAGAASGVGIQIGWGNSSQVPTLLNFSAEKIMTLPKDGSSTIRVPLAARYIQTASNPTPGKANGKVVFTINYY